MIISQKREKEIADLAEYINEEYSEEGLIKPAKKAQNKKISHSYGFYGDSFDGMLEYDNNGFHIYVNLAKGHTPESGRSRFTFSHELGHYFIDEHRRALKTGASQPHKSTIDFRSDFRVEREADTFAANLLIPQSILAEKIDKKELSSELIVELANYFKSSRTSTAIRILKLNYYPLLLVRSHNGSVTWAWPSERFKKMGLKYPVDEFADLHQGSLTYIIHECEQPTESNKKGTTANIWFNYIGEKSTKNIIMIEDVINLGEYGVLTLVYPDG